MLPSRRDAHNAAGRRSNARLNNSRTEEQIQEQRNRVRERVRRNRENNRNRAYSEFSYIIDSQDLELNELNIVEHYLGPMDVLCRHCNAKHFKSEKVSNKGNSFNDCCGHGGVKLEALPEHPEELKQLFNRTHALSPAFHDRIRVYNSSFFFASFNANLVQFNNRRPGPYCFKIQGQIYYLLNKALYPTPDSRPFGQSFIYDSQEANAHRLHENTNLDSNIISIIDNIMRSKNVFAQSYRMMHEEVQIQNNLINNRAIENAPELQLHFNVRPELDRNVYNIPNSNEVAAIFVTQADGDIPDSYVVIRNKSDRELQNISTMNENVEPWIYPLFYPFGTPDWRENLRRCDEVNKRVTRCAYTKFRIAIRPNELNAFLHGGRLFQQWVVDSYVKIEKDKIKWNKDNQKQLRADTYQGLIDHLHRNANDIGGRVGKMFILPSSFIGSPRYMMQNYQDSMAIVRKFGKPDLFITMTTNSNWREIQEGLCPGQSPADRPDPVARVFHEKKTFLLNIIEKLKFFGPIEAYVYVMEFQKRGLPHMHLLVTLKQGHKLMRPEDVDKFIKAEIPDPEENLPLHNIVMKHMIHGPCGDWCTENNKCTKNFPMPYRNETVIEATGFPEYKRRNTGKSYEKFTGFDVDNGLVVTYNPILLMLLNCHTNIVMVSSELAVKYLYKYIFKGHNRANITISELGEQREIDHDEIKDFLEARYVGPSEACWRIFSKSLQEKSHSTVRLPVHEANQQSVIIHEGNPENIDAAVNKETMLLEYLKLCSRDDFARTLLYHDIPIHYVWKKDSNNKNTWMKRQQGGDKMIGRIFSISPTYVELFHLRLLLLNIRGIKGYDDLKIIGDHVCSTFKEACLVRGLIEDDEEWRRAMIEAVNWMMPRQLRYLFVRLLIHCAPIYPEKLWTEFKDAMAEDYSRNFSLSDAHRRAYRNISAYLILEGRSLSQFPSMEQVTEDVQIDDSDEILTIEDHNRIGEQMYASLNESQKLIVDTILESVIAGNPTYTYIDGIGGSGKTYVSKTLYHLLKYKGKKIISTAFTGIAAILLLQGKTVQRTFGLPVPLLSDSGSNIKIQSSAARVLIECDVFLMDEAPMAPKYALEIIDRTLKDFMKNDLPFGGKIMLLGGDFRQLLPVQARATRSEILDLSIKYSYTWQYFKTFTLSQNMKVDPNEIALTELLLNVGNGTLNDNDNNITLPEELKAHPNDDIIKDIYSELIQQKRFHELADCAILAARNVDVDELNNEVVNLLDETTERTFTSIDGTDSGDDNGNMAEVLLPEYLNSLNPPSLPPHELRLRKNSIVMLIRNISTNEGLCNGTRLQILDFSDHLLKCEILTGDKIGNVVFLHRITLYSDKDYPFTFKRRQFPVKLAFAMTINKSQGQTFKKIHIYLLRDVFTHGLYVAMSRVRSKCGLKIYGTNGKNVVKNFVYQEVLNS